MPTTSTGADGVPINLKRPGAFVQVVFGASRNGIGGNARRVLLLGNKLASGTMVLDTEEVQFLDPDDAKVQAGEGSELHLMAVAAFTKAPGATIMAIAVTEAAGVKASATITIVGTAGGDGTAKFFIHGEEVALAVYAGQVQNTLAANLALEINARSRYLNVTATVATNVVTITCRHNGTRGNLIKLRKLIQSSISVTTWTLSGAALSGGTGTDSLTAALATASATRHHYYAVANVDTAALQAVQVQCDTMAGPLGVGKQQYVSASHDTLGTATTQATTLNEERGQTLWAYKFETLPCVIAAAWAAMRSIAEGISFSVNLCALNMPAVDLYPVVKPPPTEGEYISASASAAAMDVGLSPIEVRPGDKHCYVALSVTTHSKDTAGNPDYRTLTTNYVTVPDAFADDFAAWFLSTFPDMKIREDRQAGDDKMPPNTTTPGIVRDMWLDVARTDFEKPGHIDDLDGDYLEWSFNRAAGNPNRIAATIPITPAAWLTQISAKVMQKTPA